MLYGCTTWTLIKRMEKKINGNYTRMLRVILNKSWRQHPTKQQVYGQLLPITKTIKFRRTRHAGHCWRSKDELISDILLWTPFYRRAKAGRQVNIQTKEFLFYSCGPLHMDEQRQDDQLEPIYSSFVPMQDVAWRPPGSNRG